MKKSLLILMTIGLSGCLVPGAPHYYAFRSTSPLRQDSGYVVSFPQQRAEYQFRSSAYDSVFVFDPVQGGYRKMTSNNFYAYRTNASEKQIKELTAVHLKTYTKGTVKFDTLLRSK